VFSGFIDVWNAKTFDCELSATLAEEADLVRNYMTTEHRIFLAHDLGRALERSVVRPDNPYASSFHAFEEAIGELMRSRVMRAWHYTRLTEAEVDRLWHEGIHLSTPETLRSRFDLLVASGEVSAHLADALYAASPFHSEQLDARSNKFWMVSHPLAVDHSGVEPLMAHWGGEVASFWTKDPVLLSPLAAVGQPRVIEPTVPLALTRQSLLAGKAVVTTFGRTLGCIPSKHFFDLYVETPLRPDSVLRVRSNGDSSFRAMGLSYPEGYVDVDIGYWKELTGEDD
jgi:hypothetical protein